MTEKPKLTPTQERMKAWSEILKSRDGWGLLPAKDAYRLKLTSAQAATVLCQMYPARFKDARITKMIVRDYYGQFAEKGFTFGSAVGKKDGDSRAIQFTPYAFGAEPPKPRPWIYKPIYIRGQVSLTAARGGTGKSTLVMTECVALATSRALLGVEPLGKCRVVYWNGEDPEEELHRRLWAVKKHYEISDADLGGRLFVDSGRRMPIKVAVNDAGQFKIAEPVVSELTDALKSEGIELFVADPYVSIHTTSENDTTQQEQIVKTFAQVADNANLSVGLVHHNRKATSGPQAAIEDARGASALIDAARVRRSINTMSETEAKAAGMDSDSRHFYISADLSRSNMTKPGARHWYHLESVDLDNADFDQASDEVAVPEVWDYTSLADLPMTDEEEAAVVDTLKGRDDWRTDPQSVDYIGRAIAIALALTMDNSAQGKQARKRVKGIIHDWTKAGWLLEYEAKDTNRVRRKFIKLVASPCTTEVMQ